MTTTPLWAGALSLVLLLAETGCTQSARHAARLLDRLCEEEDLDAPTRALLERAGYRLATPERAMSGRT